MICRFLLLIIACILVIDTNTHASSERYGSKIFIDVGISGSIPKTKETHKCYDIGLKSKPADDVFFKSNADDSEIHKCEDMFMLPNQEIKNNHSYGVKFGIYKQMDRFLSVGVEAISEWYDIEYKDNAGYKFLCKHEDCEKQIKYDIYKKENNGYVKEDNQGDAKCSDLFNSRRLNLCNPIFKKTKYNQVCGLLTFKLYSNTLLSYFKLGIGVGQLFRKIPVAVAHKKCPQDLCTHNAEADCINKTSLNHDFVEEKVKTKKGLAFSVGVATKVSKNIFIGVDFLSQINKNEDGTETYKNSKVGVSLSMELGK